MKDAPFLPYHSSKKWKKVADATGGLVHYKIEFCVKNADGTYSLYDSTLIVRLAKDGKDYVYDIGKPELKKDSVSLKEKLGVEDTIAVPRTKSLGNISSSNKKSNSEDIYFTIIGI